MLLIYNLKLLVLLVVALLISACGTLEKPVNKKGPHTQFIKAQYEKAWRATQLALNKYPIATNSIDKGFIVTQQIPLNSIWSPIHKVDKVFGGERYQIKVNLIKGKIKGQPVVKIIIKKQITRYRDFIAEPEIIPSDGLEEKAILYRIKRELIIEAAIEQKSN